MDSRLGAANCRGAKFKCVACLPVLQGIVAHDPNLQVSD